MARKHTRRTRHNRRRTHRRHHRGGRGYTTAGAAELKQFAPAMYGGKSGSSSSDSGESINRSPRNRNNLTMKNGLNSGNLAGIMQNIHTGKAFEYHNKKSTNHPSLGMIGHLWSNSKNSSLRANAKEYKPSY